MPITFHQFSRKGYSLFAALGREVRIGVLSAATLATAAPCLSAPSASPVQGGAVGDDDRQLEEATVSAASLAPLAADVAARQVTSFSRDDIAAAGVTSINDLLKLCAGIDVRQRGGHGVQTDIGINGGTFDQVTILLNGVNISSPHTGHLSADFPVTAQDIERVDVLEGAAARVFGTQAFTGVINIVTKGVSYRMGENKSLSEDTTTPWSGEASASGGQYGFAQLEGRLQAYGQSLSAGYTRADGATLHSAFQSTRAFWQGRLSGDNWKLSYQAGYSNKPYDANTFYGTGSNTQWERNERWMAAVSFLTRAGKVNMAPTVSWNRWYDRYEWIKGSPAGPNLHCVDTYSANLRNWANWRAGTTAFGVEARNERILSNKLGQLLPTPHGVYIKQAKRTNVSGYLEHSFVWRQLSLSAGVLANMNTALGTRWRFYPGVDLSWRMHRHWTLFGSWNTALRMPTFTDLDYKGEQLQGTSSLLPERTSDATFKVQWRRQMWRADLSGTYSHKRDMIDWVVLKGDATHTFRSGNFEMHNWGVRLNAEWLPRQCWASCPLRSVSAQYAWLNENIHYPQPIETSKYAMEYLRHKVVVAADGRLWRGLTLSLSWRWQERTVQNGGDYSVLDGRLAWESALSAEHRLKSWTVYLDGKNLLDTHYSEYGYVPQPGIWLTAGARLKF